MTTPISFTVRPPSAPFRPSPLGQGQGRNGRSGPPSRRLFEEGADEEDDDRRQRNGHHGGQNGDSRAGDDRRDRNGIQTNEPLVIPALPNRDWRQSSSRRTPAYRPEKRDQGEVVTHERSGDEPQRSGLRRIGKQEVADDGTAVKEDPDVKPDLAALRANGDEHAEVKPKSEELSLEQQALQALLAGDHSRETEEERRQREMIIASSTNTNLLHDRARQTISEEDAYKRDIGMLPEESTADEYAAVPIEAFGAAMLRGMGWDPKNEANTKVHEPKQRPQLLGLGATPMDITIKPTHGGGKKKSGKDRREEQRTRGGRGYNAAGLLVKREREDGASGTESPGAGSSRRTSPGARSTDREGDSERDRRRKREEGDEGRAYSKKRENGDEVDYRSRDRERVGDRERDQDRYRPREYETDEERARRKEREREKYGSSNGYDRSDRSEHHRDREREDRVRGERGDRRDREDYRERDREGDRRRDRDNGRGR